MGLDFVHHPDSKELEDVFLSYNSLESRHWMKSENPLILCFIHYRQNSIESTCVLEVSQYHGQKYVE
jgi:hypothetical protein